MIGIAVIGLGNAVEPHAKSLHDLRDRARVAWAVARSESRRDVAARHGWPFTTDLHRALNDPAVHAVLILTPANQHLPVAQAAFAAGKHVLCEKPLDASLQAAERMVALARAANRVLGVVLQMRFRPGSVRLRQAITDGRTGRHRRRDRHRALVAPAILLRPARPRHPRAGWRRRADHPGDPCDRPVPLARRHLHHRRRAYRARRRCIGWNPRTTPPPCFRLGNGAPGTLFATTSLYPGRPECIEIIGTQGAARLEGGSLACVSSMAVRKR